MNNPASTPNDSGRADRNTCNDEELSALKLALMKAEMRLAKARSAAVSAEIDIKVLNTRLKALMK